MLGWTWLSMIRHSIRPSKEFSGEDHGLVGPAPTMNDVGSRRNRARSVHLLSHRSLRISYIDNGQSDACSGIYDRRYAYLHGI